MTGTQERRAGRAVFWLAGLLFLIFFALAGYQKFYANRLRFDSDQSLQEELADATLLEEPPAVTAAAPWPQWRGPRRDGVAHQPGLLTAWPKRGLRKLWQAQGGDGYASFAVAGGRVFTVVQGEDGQEIVLCWRADDGGKELWRHIYPSRSVEYGGPRATPTVDGKRVYVLGGGGRLMCLKADTGEVIWEHDLPAELKGSVPKWGFASSPLVEGDRVFVTAAGRQGTVACFDKREGTLLWSALDDPPGYSSPVAVTIAGVRQVVFFTGRQLVGLAPEDGEVLWKYPWETKFEVNAATPLPIRARSAGGKELHYVFISSGYEKGCALVKIEPPRGGQGQFRAIRVYRSNALECHFASPVRRGDYLYGLDEKRDLTCLDLRTGAVRWRLNDPGPDGAEAPRRRGFKKGSLLRVDDYLLLLSEDGRLVLAEANPDRYQEVASAQPTRRRCWTLPVLADGRLYLRDQAVGQCLKMSTPE
jgi:outer membrane protein assembly factor BamB